ncbi:MAG TPA: hypothetical protein VGB50_02535 [Flavobacterium sp.]|jgi:hypothetical protein
MKNLSFILIAFFSLLFSSCQTEENAVQNQPAGGITPNSPLAVLISRVAQHETAIDNIIDGSSCFSVQLPVTVMANNQEVVISSSAGYQQVEAILNASSSDTDFVALIFPITVIFENFQQQAVSGQTELNNILAGCASDDGFNEIRCIDFNFPVAFNTYDTLSQVATTVTINNNPELHAFITNADAADIIGIVYPVSLTLSNGQTVNVNSNSELESTITDAIDDCVDNGPGPQPDPDELFEIIIDGTWYVSYYYHNDDETSDYYGYNFTFSSNGTVTAIKNGDTYPGTWTVHEEDGAEMVDIDFDDSELGDLDDDWRVLEYDETNVRLRQDGGGDDPDRLYFTKN